jgi:preprotein translocase subunit SecD
MARPRAFGPLLLVSAFAALAGCNGCRRAPALRLTYEVDVAAAYDGEKDARKVMDTSRDIVARRLPFAGVATKGRNLVIELPAMTADEVRGMKSIVLKPGHLEFKLMDDAASDALFGAPGVVYPDGQGIAGFQEMAPAGLDASGVKKTVKGSYARIACQPRAFASESVADCLARFKAWVSTLHAPDDHQVGYQGVTEPVAGASPPQFEQVGWRTVYTYAHVELTQDSIVDARVGHDEHDAGPYYVLLSFSPKGADVFEQITGANVNRRFAIILDDIVDSAPVIKTKIGGGKATITMGAGEPEKQLHDAEQLRLVLLSGALPAPLHLVTEESLGGGGPVAR